MEALARYIAKFSGLRVDRSKGYPAPHKPVLRLAVIEGIQTGEIQKNQIFITPGLVAAFKDIWHQRVHNPRATAGFFLPFYHLKSDGFWHLKTVAGKEPALTGSHSIKSFANLKGTIEYAYLDDELFTFLQNGPTGLLLKQALLNKYFPGQAFVLSDNGLVNEIINQILNQPAAVYKTKALGFDEEEVFIRGGVFKKEIPRIYNYSCCISGMRVIADSDVQLIDACHIVPFSQSHDDTVTNGISLCPNLHRAFDRGLISLNEEYRVIVKPFFEQESFYSIRQFEGKQASLPNNKNYFPSQESLFSHRTKHGFI